MVTALLPLISIAVASANQNAGAPPPIPLASIVIVRNGLPPGCQLRPRTRVHGDHVTITGPFLPDNPWVGTDGAVISDILRSVDPPAPIPDGPPPDLKSLRRWQLQEARKISEAAAAIYDSGDASISVYALEYRDAGAMPAESSVRNSTPDTFDVSRGVLRIVMRGDGSECSLTLAKHVKSAARR